MLVSPASCFLREFSLIKKAPSWGPVSLGCIMRFYLKKSDIELAFAEAPGMSLTFSNCSMVRNRDWC